MADVMSPSWDPNTLTSGRGLQQSCIEKEVEALLVLVRHFLKDTLAFCVIRINSALQSMYSSSVPRCNSHSIVSGTPECRVHAQQRPLAVNEQMSK
jgi:hypothetical protein